MLYQEPLAYRMRPEKIEEVVGQDEIIGENTPLYKMIQKAMCLQCYCTVNPELVKRP